MVAQQKGAITLKTTEQLDSELRDAAESFEDAERAGEMLSRDTIAAMLARLMTAHYAMLAAQGRYRFRT
jgi:hypothetical protein